VIEKRTSNDGHLSLFGNIIGSTARICTENYATTTTLDRTHTHTSGVNIARSGELYVCPPLPNFNKETQIITWHKQQIVGEYLPVFELLKNLFGRQNLDQLTNGHIRQMVNQDRKHKPS